MQSEYKNILVIEDNPVNQMLMRKLLSVNGASVFEADTGMKGIESAVVNLPDLILLDLQLPEMDGYKVAETLGGREDTKNIPIIAVSANVRESDQDRAKHAGCLGFIEKPINTRTFFNEILEILEH